MALTATEEALVRQLLDQQAAILSLAGNEATITSKLGATKVTLADLVSASAVSDADLLLIRQGTTDKSVTPLLLRPYMLADTATQKGVQAGDYNTSVAGGTADAITGDYTPNAIALEDGLTLYVRATAANATTTPTFSPDGLAAKTIVKGAGTALAAGDIAGAGHWCALVFNATLDKWVLLNPYVSQPGIVLQEVEVTSTTTYALSVATQTWTDTALTATITPKRANSKIMIDWGVSHQPNHTAGVNQITQMRLKRGATILTNGFGFHTVTSNGENLTPRDKISWVDSPGVITPVTYTLQAWASTAMSIYINRTYSGAGSSVAVCKLLEIAQ